MLSKREIGFSKENLAKQYLTEKGLIVINSNFNCRLGELDLVMQDQDVIVFVEVKYRKTATVTAAIMAVDHYKQQKIIAAANFFLMQNSHLSHYSCRFDVLALWQPQQSIKVKWIKSAFEAQSY